MIKLKIKEILEERNLSTYWLSKNTSLTSPAIYKIVDGKTKGIQFGSLEEIMDVLEINSFDIILDKD